MHTPEQARELWCPMARVAQSGETDVQVAYNRTLTKKCMPMRSVKADADSFQLSEEPEESTVLVMTATPATSMAANCLGDRCAMWRWEHRTESAPTVTQGAGGQMARTYETKTVRTHGYCGLAPLHQN